MLFIHSIYNSLPLLTPNSHLPLPPPPPPWPPCLFSVSVLTISIMSSSHTHTDTHTCTVVPVLQGQGGFSWEQSALCRQCLSERTSGVTTCGGERRGLQATPEEPWSWDSLAETPLLNPKAGLSSSIPEAGTWGRAALLHLLKELTAEGCPLTTLQKPG